MKEKAKAYAKRAAAAAKKTSTRVNHPWSEDASHSPWRARIFDLEKGCRGVSCENEFEKMRDLLIHWESIRKEGAVGERNRHVILLEDLSPRIAELLGVLLEIPPEVFLSHCHGFYDLSIVDKQLFKRGSSKYWKVAVPQLRSLFQTPERGTYNILCGSFHRGSGPSVNTNDWVVNFNSYVSYWANSYEDGSWIGVSPDLDDVKNINNAILAVVMTDPHPCRLQFYPDLNPNNPRIIQLQDFNPSYRMAYCEVMLESAGGFAQPYQRSIFDAIGKVYDDAPLKYTDDPYSATCIVRNCIRAVLEWRVHLDEAEVSERIDLNVWAHQTRQKLLTSESVEEERIISERVISGYQHLMATQREIRMTRHDTQATIYTFRFRDARSLPKMNSELENRMKEEIEAWEFLDEKLRYIEEFLNDHMKMYSARSAMEETYEAKMQSRESMKQTKEANRQTAAANRMARSSGQLTKIATIIVPCTFVASIFSMGGDFAAGESLFYVYWIISVPITVGLLSWILHEDIAGIVEKSKSWINSRKTKLSEDSKV
jgi:hypothetical protein